MSVVSWLWTNPSAYNFASSEWGGLVFHGVELGALYLLLRPLYRRVHGHLECRVTGCANWGHPVHGTSFRACPEHHPHLSPGGHTVEEIAVAGGSSGATPDARSVSPAKSPGC